MGRYLVVGAGFAGAVHARTLADHGYHVDVIDQRSHVAGNAHDFVDRNGIRLHRYGPHLFHTNNRRVVDWLMRFTTFVPYEHKVRALLPSGRTVPLPVNRQTVNEVFGVSLATPDEVENYISRLTVPNQNPANAAEYLYARIGRTLTDLFFRPYTRKMWQHDLEDMDASVVQRLSFSWNDEDRYFPKDKYQLLPEHGYTRVFDAILDHPKIRVTLGIPFSKAMEADYDHVFNSMAIDEYFDYCHGELPYRSIRFHTVTETAREGVPTAQSSVVNFTHDQPLTRETHWHLLPNHLIEETGRRTKTSEEPCDYRDNALERYYPVKTADNRYQELYRRYKDEANAMERIDFIGRCGNYQYLDMDQVINQSLTNAQHFLDR